MTHARRPWPAARVYLALRGVQDLANAVMFTVYVVYFVQAARLDPLQLVLIGTVLELTYFLLETPTGVVADVYSRRLSVILGVVLLGASFVITGAVPVFAVILLAQVIAGAGYTFISGATDAWLADEVGEEQVGPLVLRAGQIGRMAGLVGAGLSVALASVWIHLPYLAGGALYLLLGVFLALCMPERGFTPKPQAERNTWAAMRATFSGGLRVIRGSPLLLMLVGVELFSGAASEGFDRLGQAHLLQNFTFPTTSVLQPVVWIGLLAVAGDLLSLAVVEPARQRLEAVMRDGRAVARLLLALEALVAAGTLTFALSGNFWLAVAALLAKSVAHSLAGPLYTAWLIQNVPGDVRATVISMVGQSNALGQMGVGPVVGAVGSYGSLRAALVTSGLLLTPVLGLLAWRSGGGPAAEASTETVAASGS